MTGLRDELSQLIEDDDERRYAFGFDKPRDPSTPEIPENVTAAPGAAGSGTLFINFDDARRARGYRVKVTNAAGGAQLASVLVEDSDATITGLPAGANVNITVTARNDAGESQPKTPSRQSCRRVNHRRLRRKPRIPAKPMATKTNVLGSGIADAVNRMLSTATSP
jgi:hypothetical protein